MADKVNEAVREAERAAAAAQSLAELKHIVENFRCPALHELRKYAKNTVFADGSKPYPLVLIGEAPGAEEDEQAMPFVGISGKRLNARLSQFGFTRESLQARMRDEQIYVPEQQKPEDCAYVTNAVFWRPLDNRKPSREEIDICRPFLAKQIELVQPKIIITLGASAINALAGCVQSMKEWRERPRFYKTIPLITAYHPSPLSARFWDKHAEEDFQKARDFLK